MQTGHRRFPWGPFLAIMLIAFAIALFSARPHAMSWNDGSRLATVESLVERNTLIIDDSIFVQPAIAFAASGIAPYPVEDAVLMRAGTLDKLWIQGHYYSDKSPVPAILMAGSYQIWRQCGGPSAADRPDWFCRYMTWTSSGFAYVLAVCGVFCLGWQVGLSLPFIAGCTLIFALGTTAIVYVQTVNNHILLLAVAVVLFCLLHRVATLGPTPVRYFLIGCWTGLGYSIDLAAGPMLTLCITAWLAFQGLRGLSLRKTTNMMVFGLGVLPGFATHHLINFAIGGTFVPANAIPAYLAWPGSPFTATNMTGGWNHPSVLVFVRYALDMLVGKRGFLSHQVILFLPLLTQPLLFRRRFPERSLLLMGWVWFFGTWLLYGATSRNMSGVCCSIRWFVPLLVPGFFGLAVLLRERPDFRPDSLLLGLCSTLLGISMALVGPWYGKIVPGFWPSYAAALLLWTSLMIGRQRRARTQTELGSIVVSSELVNWTVSSRRQGQGPRSLLPRS